MCYLVTLIYTITIFIAITLITCLSPGYPLYTKPNDILEVFKKFGNVRVDECNSFSATLTYFTEQHAKNAIAANKRLHIYGHFLSVKPLTEKAYALKEPMSPKREFPQSKYKYINHSVSFSCTFYSANWCRSFLGNVIV